MSTEIIATSVTAAIKAATTGNCTRMVQVSPGSFEVQTYDPIRNAFIAGPTMDFHRARAALTEQRHRDALVAMGWDEYVAEMAAGRAVRGSLRDRVKESVSK